MLLPVAGMVALLFASFFTTWQIVLLGHITSKKQAMLVGVVAVPCAFAVAVYLAATLLLPTDQALPPGVLAGFSMVVDVCGGWAGALSYLTNCMNSDRPELRRQYQEVADKATARAERGPGSRSVESWLRTGGLPETRVNVWLFQIGAIVATVAFVAVMCRMIGLGFEEPHTLAHLPLRLRLLGAMAPFAAPGLLWTLTRRAVPALGVGLRYALIPQMVLWALAYIVCSLRAVGA